MRVKQLFCLLVLLAMPLIFQPTFYQVLKLKTFDALVEEREPSNYFSILNITEQDVEEEGGYPLPRKRLAEIQNELINQGALGVGWVYPFLNQIVLMVIWHLQKVLHLLRVF